MRKISSLKGLTEEQEGIFMDYRDRIISDPDIMTGKPVIKGMRITVEIILRKLSEGMTFEELLEAYPGLKREDLLVCLSYASDVI